MLVILVGALIEVEFVLGELVVDFVVGLEQSLLGGVDILVVLVVVVIAVRAWRAGRVVEVWVTRGNYLPGILGDSGGREHDCSLFVI